MAILGTPVSTGTCPKCGSRNIKIEYKKLDSSDSSVIKRKYIKCNKCGYEG